MKYDYVLDTYALVELFNGTKKGQVVGELLVQGKSAISILALAELSDKCAKENRAIQPFVDGLKSAVAILPLTQEIALQTGKTKQKLRMISKNVSFADCVHFLTAQSVEASFVTGDSDFQPIKEQGILFLE